MAQPVVVTKSKDHRRRKNPRSAELHAEERKQRNAARGKQVWIGTTVADGGFWERVK